MMIDSPLREKILEHVQYLEDVSYRTYLLNDRGTELRGSLSEVTKGGAMEGILEMPDVLLSYRLEMTFTMLSASSASLWTYTHTHSRST